MIDKIIKQFYSIFCKNEIEANQALINNLNNKIDSLTKENDSLKTSINLIEPQSLGTISLLDTYSLLSNLSNNVYISDNSFNLTSVEEAKKFTEETKVAYKQWVQESHDCDNFSFALLGYWSDSLKSFAFGMCWSLNHAFNIFIDDKKQIWIIEPQTNKFYTLEEAKKVSTPDGLSYWPIRLIVM